MATTTYRPNSDGSTAWDVDNSSSTEIPPSTFLFDNETEFSGAQRNTASTDDTNMVFASTSPYGGFKVRINIDESVNSITQLDIQMKIDWNGPVADGNSQNVHIWNNDSETWIALGQLTGTENPSIQTSNNEITEGIENYIDGSGNLYYSFANDAGSPKQSIGLAYTQTLVTFEESSPQMNVKGNDQSIPSGSDTPSLSDHTDFGEVSIN